MPLKEGSWQMPPMKKGYRVPWLWKLSTRFAVTTVGFTCKFWLEWLNKARFHNREILHDMFDKTPDNRGLLTVSNHSSCIDDPLMWGALKARQIANTKRMRYSSAAEDVCFKGSNLLSTFFSLGKVFPIVRGDGVYQKGMDYMVDQLDLGNWCHIFPEGKINMTNEFLRLKWGVGRAVADCQRTPIVLPIWHVGMDSVLPNSRPYIPQIRKHVTILIGEPLDFSSDLERLRSMKKTPKEIRKHITDKIQEEFKSLKVLAEAFHKEFKSS
ncbi:tafazzin [Aplysia californica]|uniref:Tafazzin family protein n=1 Tax=Aplysia californica TaxID=6500 RepID=A0ABM0JRA1_APLCA|nr:tafazzin [Aplysia californica]XP_035825995.1 tafazzin [Aplysia californica]